MGIGDLIYSSEVEHTALILRAIQDNSFNDGLSLCVVRSIIQASLKWMEKAEALSGSGRLGR